MFVFNISVKKSKVFLVIIIALIILLLFGIFITSLNSKKVFVNDNITPQAMSEISPNNYTSILKDSYKNIDAYVGKKIKFSGFVYRLYDFKDTQFVLGREMIVSEISNNQAQVVVVGFLCESKNAKEFDDETWVEVEGTIKKGRYHSDLPIIEVTSMKKINCPENPYVYPPDNSYVKTEII